MIPSHLKQDRYDVRCEWGERGVDTLAPLCNAIAIIDVLSFSTCVCIAVERGAKLVPWEMDTESAIQYAKTVGAIVSGSRSATSPSLSPQSWLQMPPSSRVVLRSPNGAALSRMTGDTMTVAACFRNALAVAKILNTVPPPIGIIPAGERWSDGSTRFAIEDYLGAGAVISRLAGSRSPEAEAAMNLYQSCMQGLEQCVRSSISGVELASAGFETDIAIACQCDVSQSVPVLSEGQYVEHGDHPDPEMSGPRQEALFHE